MPTIAQVLSSKPAADQGLQAHINWWLGRGYRVVSQTEATAQLVKPKSFSFVWAFLWLLLLGFGVLVYLIYYAAKKDQLVYLSVSNGHVTANESRG